MGRIGLWKSLPGLDPRASATGQATAFSAQADDPSAILYTPAGMTQLRGVQFYIGTNHIGGQTTFTSDSGTKVEGDFGGPIASPPPSQVYLTANLEDLRLDFLKGWTVGLGVTSPFGINMEYSPTSQVALVLSKAALPLLDLNPTFAFTFNEYISIGAGLDIYTFASFLGEGQAEVQVRAAPGYPFGLPPGTPLEANGTGTAVGFNTSLLRTPFRHDIGKPLMNVSFVYRIPTNLDLRGEFLASGTFVANSQAILGLPQFVNRQPVVEGTYDTTLHAGGISLRVNF